MADSTRPRVAVLSRTWEQSNDDRAFVLRELAGALSRHTEVEILIPGHGVRRQADGLYQPYSIGQGRDRWQWPSEAEAAWPFAPDDSPHVILTDAADEQAITLARHHSPDSPIALVTGHNAESPLHAWDHQRWYVSGLVDGAHPRSSDHLVGLSIPVNPLASVQRHNGLGFVDYILMLTDRCGEAEHDLPPAAVAWVTARFPDENVVLVESARALVWRGRAHRGTISVDTRTDLWRLMAHAKVTVDLRPGHLIGRECIESLRFGTPIISPAVGVGLALSDAGAGLMYRTIAELLACLEVVNEPDLRNRLSEVGQAVADRDYGDTNIFVERVGVALAAVAGSR